MRISDWSSDVCSSDLIKAAEPVVDRRNQFLHRFGIAYVRGLRQNLRSSRLVYGGLRRLELFLVAAADCHACAQRSEERRVGKEWSVRVDLGGSRLIKKKRNENKTR